MTHSLTRIVLGTALLLRGCSYAFAQSHELNQPTPLGPGINKGNIDNMGVGPHFYYFVGGPGKFDVHFAFHEMGMFGNPFPQALNFDVINESDKVVAHDAVRSSGNLARFTQPGLTDRPKRFVIRVSPQKGVIRLGGYYEIEVTGIASFDGKTVGAGVTPQMSPQLVHPQADSLIHPNGSLVQPSGSLVHSTGPLVHEAGPLLRPVGALIQVEQAPDQYRLTLAADILFDFDRSTIRPDAREALERVAAIIRLGGTGAARIEGFTDSKGAADYNLKLSMARAKAVARWLVEQGGLSSTGLSAEGFGATRFAAPNTNADGSDAPEGRQKNRRVEVVVARHA